MDNKNLLTCQHFHLVGIKGVAMTSMAQILLDAGKNITGSDVKEEFVTQGILEKIRVKISFGFDGQLPAKTDCVIFTAAHGGPDNKQVRLAKKHKIPTFSQAKALALLFNQKKGLAICGVGGKSSVSAMVAFILDRLNKKPSFSVGVGNIPGLEKTGQWVKDSDLFVSEADEYVVDPAAPNKNQEIKPRFSYLTPYLTLCTNLKFDHPDVYTDLDHTKQVYLGFFNQVKNGGYLVVNEDDVDVKALLPRIKKQVAIFSFGESKGADYRLQKYMPRDSMATADLFINGVQYELKLQIPGKYNALNAVASIAVCHLIGLPITECIKVLSKFRSTKRRFEFIGEKNGVLYYDDYAHHPREIKAVIEALNTRYPKRRVILAFQSHTYSRTKKLFSEFVDSFEDAGQVLMIDIFASAREKLDISVSSDLLCKRIRKKFPNTKAKNLKTIQNLKNYFEGELKSGDIVMTIGAGNIYQVHDLI